MRRLIETPPHNYKSGLSTPLTLNGVFHISQSIDNLLCHVKLEVILSNTEVSGTGFCDLVW